MKPLEPMKECRCSASSVVYDNQKLLVSGGYISVGGIKSIEMLSLNAVHVNQTINWEYIAGELPIPLWGHRSVIHNGRLIVIGGRDGDKSTVTDTITEVSLVPPYTSKLLSTVPQTKWHHGVAIFGDKVLIVAGAQDQSCKASHKTVLLYDITKNECQNLVPLPYAVCEAATVKWGDDNVVIAGGVNSKGKALNKVLLYNIKTQKSHELPSMKYYRKGCVAAVVSDTVIVMGGIDEGGNFLKSVESFRFDSYSWQNLPEMHEERYCATAVVC